MPRVLITGAAGVLGRTVTSLLEQEPGIALRLTDMAPLDTRHEFVRADLANWEETKGLCQGVDEVLHAAAIHPWKKYSPQQYVDCNIKGTYNMTQWLHVSDIAMAHVLALRSELRNEALIIAAKVPFTRADAPALLADARPVILRCFPKARLLEERGIQLPKRIDRGLRLG
ncbi:MAG: NAD-dependent epimerase/dehydratase family protein [Planctomycetes bacterium]|nr:NAD-dependent epimerase/dehydratase family protein [Planctomycetota bacterium]